jgi:hypothetical protein
MFCTSGWQSFSTLWHVGFGLPLLIVALAFVGSWLGRASGRPAGRTLGLASCPSCGRQVDASWAFCPMCGHASTARTADQPNPGR